MKKNNIYFKKGFIPTPSFSLSKIGTAGNRKKKNLVWGFSLIEMLVSIALFSVIMVIAVGIIVIILNTNKNARSTSIAMGNIDVIMEKIFREASVGSYYHCGKSEEAGKWKKAEEARNCPGGNPLTAFAFEGVGGNDSSPDDQIIYQLNSTDSALEVSRDGGATFEKLTDENIIIDDFNVNVIGNSSKTKQPAVFISMRGYIKQEGDSKTFAVQTMISERFDPSTLR